MKPEDFDLVRDVLSSIHERVKRKSEDLFGPSKYSLKGKDFACSHCGNELFFRSKRQPNTRLSSLLGLEFLADMGVWQEYHR